MFKLNARQVETLSEKGKYHDGGGLILVVNSASSKSWVFRHQKSGNRREYGLGSYPTVSLKEARDKTNDVRRSVEIGIDPVEQKKSRLLEQRRIKELPTFEIAATRTFEQLAPTFRNMKHSKQWLSELVRYAFPVIGKVRIDQLGHKMVMDVLVPIWVSRYETAKRIKQRIIAIVDWAVAHGYREIGLPIGAINQGLPRVKRKENHFAALQYSEVKDCLGVIKSRETMGSFTLEALILTAVRSGEIRGAKWSEIDLENMIWTIPAERMKAFKEHKVPLSKAALSAFFKAKKMSTHDDELIFQTRTRGKPQSDMTLTKALRDLGFKITVHGFRSTFRDWIANETEFDGELAEMALAHTIKNSAESAYRRGNLLEKRRKMMQSWSEFCEGRKAAV